MSHLYFLLNFTFITILFASDSNIKDDYYRVTIGGGYKVKVPRELSVKTTNGPDFKVLNLTSGKSTVLFIYTGDHPDTSSFDVELNVNEISFPDVKAKKTSSFSGKTERIEFLIMLNTDKSPKFAHAWFFRNPGDDIPSLALKILATMKKY